MAGIETWLLLFLLSGLIMGSIFGFILQRGRFCMNSAFRDIIVLKDYKLMKSVVVAWLVSMIGFSIMAFSGIITLNPKPLVPMANIIGGLIFGAGMVLGAGCASGTTYRVGEGMMGSLVALLGFMIGATATKAGALLPVTMALQSFNLGPLTLLGALTPIFMLIIGIVGFVIILWKWILPESKANKEKEGSMFEKIFKKGWHWAPTGIAIGILAWFAYVLSAAAGRNYPLGITGGWVAVTKYLTGGMIESLSWEAFLVLGVIIGAFIAAKISGEFKLRTPKDAKKILTQFIGGLMMGIGAVIAMGCNIGHALSGVPLLSLGSILATGSIILGCWIMAYLLFMRD